MMDVLLEGIVGSQAYGLATPDSDVDRLGIFRAPTDEILGLDSVNETHVSHDPDRTLHEVEKSLRLALRCNPTVLELLFLSEYETVTDWGNQLVNMREAFLSNLVRKTYYGYAWAQMEKLQRRGDFGSTLKNRYAKHARHMFRLLHQGQQLLETGTLDVKVQDPDFYHWVGTLPPEKLVWQFEEQAKRFKLAESVLPEEPYRAGVNELLLAIRHS